MRDQAEVLRKMAKPGDKVRPRIIAVTSGKGGVGKTNITVNLALTLAGMGYRVALMDADMGLANVDIILGLSPPFSLANVLRGEKSMDEVMVDGPLGLKLFAGDSGVYDMANLTPWRLQEFVRSVEQLDTQFDFIFVDTGGGLHRNVLTFVLAAEEVLVITTPEPTALTDAYGIIKIVTQQKPPATVRLVVNMTRDTGEGELVFNKLNTVLREFQRTEVEYAGCVPYDRIVNRSVSEQKPFILAYPASPASRSIGQLARSLVETEEQTTGTRGVRGFLARVYQFLHK